MQKLSLWQYDVLGIRSEYCRLSEHRTHAAQIIFPCKPHLAFTPAQGRVDHHAIPDLKAGHAIPDRTYNACAVPTENVRIGNFETGVSVARPQIKAVECRRFEI